MLVKGAHDLCFTLSLSMLYAISCHCKWCMVYHIFLDSAIAGLDQTNSKTDTVEIVYWKSFMNTSMRLTVDQHLFLFWPVSNAYAIFFLVPWKCKYIAPFLPFNQNVCKITKDFQLTIYYWKQLAVMIKKTSTGIIRVVADMIKTLHCDIFCIHTCTSQTPSNLLVLAAKN